MTGMIVSTFKRANSIARAKTCKCSVMIRIHSRTGHIQDTRRQAVSWTSSSQQKKAALSGITRRRLRTYLIPFPRALMLYHLGSRVLQLGAATKINSREWGIYPCWWVCRLTKTRICTLSKCMEEIIHLWIQATAKSKGELGDNQGATRRLRNGELRSPRRGHNTRSAPWTSLYLGKHRLITPY